jgi:signal transduction histidine kinase
VAPDDLATKEHLSEPARDHVELDRDVGEGSGLAGLRDRVGALDGDLHLLSPAGGPTVLMVEIPCAS